MISSLSLYVKFYSYCEYVFDWACGPMPMNATASIITPSCCRRLRSHPLPAADQASALRQAGFMLRSGVQFHWLNAGYADFATFLNPLERKKRKNILAERSKVAKAGVRFHHMRDSLPIASSLLVYNGQMLYSGYWGAIEEVSCLHFETVYYESIEFCIAQKITCFQDDAQDEHKMALGFLPKKTWSGHWLAHPDFSDAVDDCLKQEAHDINNYTDKLNEHNPFRSKVL